MSAATARATEARAVPRPRPSAPAAAPAPRLRVVAAPAQARTRVPFVLACMAVLAVALLAALLLNTSTAGEAFERYTLTNKLARLEQDQMDLRAQLDAKSSPANLAASARAIGMVPANGTGWLRLSDGSVQGAPAPAGPRR
jgi:hypothetical protein